jgi:antirestriction protein ArdC
MYRNNGKYQPDKARETYDRLVASFIEQLSNGVAPWTKPWSDSGFDPTMPHNAVSGRSYHGVNVWLLWGAAQALGYPSNAWLTYHQASTLGGHVRKGEHGQLVILWKRYTKLDATKADDDPERERSFLLMRGYTVFNVAQCEGLPEKFSEKAEPKPIDIGEDDVAKFIAALGSDLRHGGDRAFYSPTHDFVQMPNPEQFRDRADYLSTNLHEHAHWSGHDSRLARTFGARFGDQAYAMEELVAEMTSAFLCATLGIEGKLQHAEYLANWAKTLGEHRTALWTAASKASAAAEYLKGKAGLAEDEDGEGEDEAMPMAA